MKKLRSMFIATIFMLLAIMPAFAANASPQVAISLRDVIETLERSFSDSSRYSDGTLYLSDFDAEFFQRTVIAGKEDRELKASGRLSFRNADYRHGSPIKFRFEYYRPTAHEIISDGVSLWTYLPENRQVILSDVSEFYDPMRADPSRNRGFNFLQGLPRLSKDFSISYSPQGRDLDNNYILELTPRQAMESIEKLYIVVKHDSARRFVQNGRQIINSANKSNRRQDQPYPELACPLLSTTVIDHKGNSTIMEFSNIRPNVGIPDMMFNFDITPDLQVVRPPGSR